MRLWISREQAVSDRRRQPRMATRVTATIELEDGGDIACVMHDRSGDGARLIVERTERVPERFRLRLGSEATTSGCIVRWRSATELGVELMHPLP